MYPVNPIKLSWAPSGSRASAPRMGQFSPYIGPVNPVAPAAAATAVARGPGDVMAGLGMAVGLGVGVLGVLFNFGIASESKSNLVKVTGYSLAGIGVLGLIVGSIGAVIVAADSY
jgi:hypothetical protein